MNTQPIDEKAVFNAARQIADGTDREAYLTRTCGDDHLAIQRIRELLRIHEQEQSFLESPAGGIAATNNIRPLSEQPGAIIGPYKLLQEIGEGGMGVVFMAEQTEPVARKVALKIIKSGMDTRQVIARFEAERQALALMDHPNIAKILDAGTELGRPYFVMELVKGVPIVQYCDVHRLPPAQRLELFITVCHAVQHAHQKGIIHRDLKPTNILVADYDDKPAAKVIDFGVAKAIGQELTEKTMFTQFGQMVGTLEYMSPEQAKLNQLDIDTRSDLYSLGVLLYELLTGTTPFGRGRLQSAAFDEMLRIIREEEPEKPSTRLSTTKELPSIAACRQLEPKKLAGLMKGELDWVVMKSLEKDRSRRYETANAFAQDIERYLRDEPVAARPTSSLYRAGKTIKRNRLAFAAACCVAAALVLGGIISTWQAIRATHSEHEQSRLLAEAEQARSAEEQLRQRAEAGEKQARTEATKSQQVAAFMQRMLSGVKPWVAKGRDTKLLQDIVDSTSQRLDKELADQPEVEADLRYTLGGVYYNLEEYAKAEAMVHRSLELRKQIYGEAHAKIADALVLLGAITMTKDFAAAESFQRQALAMRKKLYGDESPEAARSLDDLGLLLSREGKLDEAEDVARQALAIDRKLLRDDDESLAFALRELARTYIYEHRSSEAEPLLREALAIDQKQAGNNDQNIASTKELLAWLLDNQRRYKEEETELRQVLELEKTGDTSCFAVHLLGNSLLGQNRLAEAEEADRKAIAMFTFDDISVHFFPELNYKFSTILRLQGKLGEAEPAARRACQEETRIFSDHNTYYFNYMLELADVLRDEGKLAEAEATDRKLIAGIPQLKSGRTIYPPTIYNNLATVLVLQGRLEEAEAASRKSLELERKIGGDQSRRVARFSTTLANILCEAGKLDEAQSVVHDALATLDKTNAPGLKKARADIVLGNIQRANHQYTEAEASVRKALDLQLKNLFSSTPSFEDERTDLAKTLDVLVDVLRYENQAKAAESLQREMLEKARDLVGDDQPLVAEIKGQIAQTLLAVGKAAEAEPLARQAVELKQKFTPDAWQTFRAECLLGQCLLEQEKYTDAEPLLQSGYVGMEKLTHGFPAAHGNEIKQALRSLTKLSQSKGQPEEAAQWQEKLADIEKTESPPGDVSQTSSNH